MHDLQQRVVLLESELISGRKEVRVRVGTPVLCAWIC